MPNKEDMFKRIEKRAAELRKEIIGLSFDGMDINDVHVWIEYTCRECGEKKGKSFYEVR